MLTQQLVCNKHTGVVQKDQSTAPQDKNWTGGGTRAEKPKPTVACIPPQSQTQPHPYPLQFLILLLQLCLHLPQPLFNVAMSLLSLPAKITEADPLFIAFTPATHYCSSSKHHMRCGPCQPWQRDNTSSYPSAPLWFQCVYYEVTHPLTLT